MFRGDSEYGTPVANREMSHNRKFADDNDETGDDDADADAGLVMSFRALVKTVQFPVNSADFERW
jgi:hypothetical protein